MGLHSRVKVSGSSLYYEDQISCNPITDTCVYVEKVGRLVQVYPHLYIDLRDRYREFMAEAHYPAGKCTYNVRTLYVQARTYGFGTNNIRNESF